MPIAAKASVTKPAIKVVKTPPKPKVEPKLEFQSIGRGIEAAIDDSGKMLIRLDVNGDLGPSSTGKTLIVASMGRPIQVAVDNQGREIYLNLTAFKYAEAKQ